jgi:hypothetical protein
VPDTPEKGPQNVGRGALVAFALLGTAGLVAGVALVLDLGPFDEERDRDPPAAEQLVVRGDAICREARRRFEPLTRDPPDTAAEAEAFTRELLAISKEELRRLRELEAPDEFGPALDRFLEARADSVALIREGLAAAARRDAAGYARAQGEVAAGQVERLRLAQAVGFRDCGRPFGVGGVGE